MVQFVFERLLEVSHKALSEDADIKHIDTKEFLTQVEHAAAQAVQNALEASITAGYTSRYGRHSKLPSYMENYVSDSAATTEGNHSAVPSTTAAILPLHNEQEERQKLARDASLNKPEPTTRFRPKKNSNLIVSNEPCHACGVTEAPQWRRGGLARDKLLCNRCGMHWMRHQKMPPYSKAQSKTVSTTKTEVKNAQGVDKALVAHNGKERCSSPSPAATTSNTATAATIPTSSSKPEHGCQASTAMEIDSKTTKVLTSSAPVSKPTQVATSKPSAAHGSDVKPTQPPRKRATSEHISDPAASSPAASPRKRTRREAAHARSESSATLCSHGHGDGGRSSSPEADATARSGSASPVVALHASNSSSSNYLAGSTSTTTLHAGNCTAVPLVRPAATSVMTSATVRPLRQQACPALPLPHQRPALLPSMFGRLPQQQLQVPAVSSVGPSGLLQPQGPCYSFARRGSLLPWLQQQGAVPLFVLPFARQ